MHGKLNIRTNSCKKKPYLGILSVLHRQTVNMVKCFENTVLGHNHSQPSTAPFKAVYLQIFCKKYCQKAIEAAIMKKNHIKAIDLRNTHFDCSFLVSIVFCSHLNTNTNQNVILSGDINVNEDRDFLL